MMTKNIWIFALVCIVAGTVSCSKKDDPEKATVYTVTFETNGGIPVPSVQSVEAGGTARAPADSPTRPGYVFLSWSLDGVTNYDFSTPVTGNITIRARWQEEAATEYWKVTWELNGGTWPEGRNHATQVVKGGTLAEPAAPAKQDDTFEGWYKEADLTNRISFPYDVSAVTGHFTLYARWTNSTGGTTAPVTFPANATAGQQASGKLTGISIAFRYVPGGSFVRDNTGNTTTITRGFWMAETEVTQELYLLVMGNNPSYFDGSSGGSGTDLFPYKSTPSGETQNKRPVDRASWYDAIAFCNKLSLLDGKEPVYSISGVSNWSALTYSQIPTEDDTNWNTVTMDMSKNGYRLPTDMEHMWASMGADKTSQPNTKGYLKRYPGDAGDVDPSAYTWISWGSSTSNKRTHEVGLKRPNELNIYDLGGNLNEWCWDWYGSYPSGQGGHLTDPTGSSTALSKDWGRITRGGSWYSAVLSCHIKEHNEADPFRRSNVYGFRVVCSGN